jgi:hypothetical protein
MAEAIGLASSLLAIALFTFNSCSTLYQTAKSIQNYPQTILDLITELGDFIAVLQKSAKDNRGPRYRRDLSRSRIRQSKNRDPQKWHEA